MSTTYQKIDRHIIDLLGRRDGPATKNTIVFLLKRENLHEGKSDRVVAERIYALKREGKIVPIGIAGDTRYTLPDKAPGQPSERARQLAEAQQRHAEAQPAGQLGECDLIDLGDSYVLEPRPAPMTPAEDQPQPVAKAEPESEPQTVVVIAPPPPEPQFEGRVDAIAQHIGTTVTLTVRQLITEAIAEARATVEQQRQQIATLVEQQQQWRGHKANLEDQIERLKQEIAEQEQLYNDLDRRYTAYRQRIAQAAEG